MKALSIVLRLLAILGALAAGAAWYLTNGKLDESNQKIAQIRTQANEAESQLAEKDTTIAGLRGNVSDLENQLADEKSRSTNFRTQYSQAQREITTLRDDKKGSEDKYAELERRHDQLKRELIELNTTRSTAGLDPSQVSEYEDKIAALQNDLQQTRNQLASLQSGGVSTAAPVAAGTAVAGTVTPLAGGSTAAPVEGATAPVAVVKGQAASILRYDLDNGILVISRGQVDGLQRQMEFNVTKGLSKQVKVKVGTVAPTYSVAYILPGQDPSHLQEGDQIQISR